MNPNRWAEIPGSVKYAATNYLLQVQQIICTPLTHANSFVTAFALTNSRGCFRWL